MSAGGTPVGIFSLEMSAQQLVQRMLSAEKSRRRVEYPHRTWIVCASLHWHCRKRPAVCRKRRSSSTTRPQFHRQNAFRGTPFEKRAWPGSDRDRLLAIDDYQQETTTIWQPVTEDFTLIEAAGPRARRAGLGIAQLSRAVESRGGRLACPTCVTPVPSSKDADWSCSFTARTGTRNSTKKTTLRNTD